MPFFYSYSDVNNLIVMFGRSPPYSTMMVDIIGIVVNYIASLVNAVGLQEETVQRRLFERENSAAQCAYLVLEAEVLLQPGPAHQVLLHLPVNLLQQNLYPTDRDNEPFEITPTLKKRDFFTLL